MQQIIPILIDKLIIGVLLAIAAYFGSRTLESYKKRQAVAGEIAKQRIQKIAETWEHLNEWDFLIEEILRALAKLAIIHHPEGYRDLTAGRQIQPGLTPASEVYDALEVLQAIIPQLRGEDLLLEWEAKIAPLLIASNDKGRVVSNIIRKNRFWLGVELYDFCHTFEKTLDRSCRAIKSMDLDILVKQLAVLETSRKDVLTILKHVD